MLGVAKYRFKVIHIGLFLFHILKIINRREPSDLLKESKNSLVAVASCDVRYVDQGTLSEDFF